MKPLGRMTPATADVLEALLGAVDPIWGLRIVKATGRRREVCIRSWSGLNAWGGLPRNGMMMPIAPDRAVDFIHFRARREHPPALSFPRFGNDKSR